MDNQATKEGWRASVQDLRQRLDALIESVEAYRESIAVELAQEKENKNRKKRQAVLEWQLDLVDELLESLEFDVTEGVIRIAEQDHILFSDDVDNILV